MRRNTGQPHRVAGLVRAQLQLPLAGWSSHILVNWYLLLDRFASTVRACLLRRADPSLPSMPPLPPTPRTTLKRHAERGSHERVAIDAILDEALLCHVAVNVGGAPRVLPTAHVRVGDHVYLHGARANQTCWRACERRTRLFDRDLARRPGVRAQRIQPLDELSLGGAVRTAKEVTDSAEKHAALCALIDHMAPGRSGEARLPNEEELRTTLLVKWPIVEASAKVRVGPPLDRDADMAWPCWAGVLPVQSYTGGPRADPELAPDHAPSPAVAARAALLAPHAPALYERSRAELCVSTDAARIDFGFVHRFLAHESYWARGVDPELQRRSMLHSLDFGLYRGQLQLGFARVLTDFGRLAYLGDVFIEQSQRGQGLCTWLLECVFEHPDLVGIDRWLLGTADAHSLYERFGFVRAAPDRYMVRRGTPTIASKA